MNPSSTRDLQHALEWWMARAESAELDAKKSAREITLLKIDLAAARAAADAYRAELDGCLARMADASRMTPSTKA